MKKFVKGVRFTPKNYSDEVEAKIQHYKREGYKLPSRHLLRTEEQLAGIRERVATFFGYLYEALHLRAYLSDHIHARGVGEISFIYGRYIYVDNISAAQKFFGAGDAMAHYVIDADAYAFWEPLVQERGGNGIMVCREAIYHVVYFCGRHPFANIL